MENKSYQPQTELFNGLQYFVPSQMVLHMEHPSNVTQDDLFKAISDLLSGPADAQEGQKPEYQIKTLEEQKKKKPIKPPSKESILTFPLEDDNGLVFSIVTVPLDDPEMGQKDLLNFVHSNNGEIGDKGFGIGDNITLRSMSPSWLISSTHHGSATGGPGGWPVEAQAPHGDSWKFRRKSEQTSLAALPLMSVKEDEVHIAILDTAPSTQTLVRAYHDWKDHHPLIEALLGPHGRLHVYPATQTDLYPLTHYSPMAHRYLMPDHGLFIAGVIHSIAPKAILHLYEVLNPYGVGSIETIAQGLLKILSNPQIGRPLIINCSLMLNIPVEGVSDKDFPDVLRSINVLGPMTMWIQKVFEQLAKQKDVTVIAAAGNDANHNNANPGTRPPARYPAAFEGVVGVGGVAKGFPHAAGMYEHATYSNLSDAPPKTGYITFGGEQGTGRGVLGIYISDFPEPVAWPSLLWRFLRLLTAGRWPNPYASTPDRVRYRRNKTGWAWWAGTSFATPIITGIVATDGRELLPPDGSILPPPYQTAQNEIVIPVEQG